MLFELAFQLFDKPRNERPLLSQCGNDVRIGHPDMVGWRMARLNQVVVALAT